MTEHTTSHAPVTDENRKISVFVPIFNGAGYIGQTLHSLLAQTLHDFEVLCIDDCSTDNSLEILQRFAQLDSRIRILQTPKNFGLASKALNYALDNMAGGYFVYSSQDDLFSPDWLEKMLFRSIETNADAVIPDLVFYSFNKAGPMQRLSGLHGDRSVILDPRSAVQYSLRWEIPGNAMWNANLVKKHRFEDFGLNADELSGRIFFLNCNHIAFSEGCFYYRQDNPMAVTKQVTYKTFDFPYTQYKLYEFLKTNGFPQAIVHSEAIKTIEMIRGLQQWLFVNRDAMQQEDAAKAEARLQRTLACLSADPMFAAVM